MSLDLFARETRAVDEAKAALKGGEANPDRLRTLLDSVVAAQSKTVKRAEKLVRLSDRTEIRLRDATARIERQQVELEAANTKLAMYADDLESKVAARTADLVIERAKLAKLVDLGIGMAGERDEATLLWMIISGAMELTHADGGTVYLMDDKSESLTFRIVRNRSLDIELGTDPDQPVPLPSVAMRDKDTGERNLHNVVTSAVWTRKTSNIPDAYASQDYDFSGTQKFDAANGYRSTSFLTVPLIPRGGSVIGALQLINATDPETGEIIPFDAELQGFVEALAAQAAVTIDNQKLLMAQRNLMDSFIELIAGAIDAKSPYTGGHCNRVPELAFMLAQKAHDAEVGPFSDFHFRDDDEWREFRIGAWLHDCGKVTTPEYVVDKATKLETIYNRIHEVRTRFEVLYRDRKIAALEDRLLGVGQDVDLDKDLAGTLESLREDFAFIAECNIGGEFLDDDRIERLASLAKTPWTRYFDERLGISRDEAHKLEAVPAAALPVAETLLSDKPWHASKRDRSLIDRLRAKGFKMEIPENESNLGELYNLTIQRGTLTDEERFKINEHIIQTIVMLETLPFPPHMRRVPEYAGGHHETMIGTGYPRKLTRDEMSVPARIMAVADIFEALTAADRPYKPPKKLSDALKIMGFMCKDHHIDPEIYALFLQERVYLEYANAYLDPSQIDEVPLEALLADAEAMCASVSKTI
jgi:HD-GYP domain-containing protein (c-di-GMP phosphodiesterase class II)